MTDEHTEMERRMAGAPTGEHPDAELGSTLRRAEKTMAGLRVGDGRGVLERLRSLPGGSDLLAVANRHGGSVELVGGAVRDIMLGIRPRELDVVVEGDAHAFAVALAQRLGALAGADPCDPRREVTYHERFGTALVRWSSGEIDVAMRRRETYSSPGALPDVTPGNPEQDLRRRDFTINAIAVGLTGDAAGRLRPFEGALEDLAARRLRVLHEESFLEDPTRILRLARYATRLGFEVEPRTAALAAAALDGGALKTVSGQRLGAELRLALDEPDPVATLAELDRMGVLTAWQPGVSFDAQVARTALEILPEDGSVRVLLAASLLFELAGQLYSEERIESDMLYFLRDAELPAGEGERVFDVAAMAAFAVDRVDHTDMMEELLDLTQDTPVESLALAGALRDIDDGPDSYGRRVVEEWLGHQRHVKLQITGDDLIAAGVPEGPEIGLRLEASYRMLLAEAIEAGRETELQAALEAKL